MIWESGPWKDRLLKDADVIERWAAKAQATERRSVLIEQKIFVAAYSVRKLFEAGKISTLFEERSIPCSKFPCVSDRVTSMNCHRFSELYDLDAPENGAISIRDLLNLIIHSLVFSEQLSDDLTIEGFFVTSDHQRYRFLYLVSLPAFLRLMRDVGCDYPSHGVQAFDPEKNEWYVWQGYGDPPAHVTDRLQAIMDKRTKSPQSG